MLKFVEDLESRAHFTTTPGLVLDVVAVSATGTGVTVVNTKNVQVNNNSTNGSVTFEVRATVTGANNTATDEGLTTAFLRLYTKLNNGGAILGDLTSSGSGLGLQSPFNFSLAYAGNSADLNKDTMLDIGSTDINSSSGQIAAIAFPSATGSGTGSTVFTLYRFRLDIKFIIPPETNRSTQIVLDRPTGSNGSSSTKSLAPQWTQDGVGKNATTGVFSLGGPITITSTSAQSTSNTIIGRIYNDANASGGFDAGEAGLSGRTAYIDSNKNGLLDAGETYALTDANGFYRIATKRTGAVRIRQTLPSGWNIQRPVARYYDANLVVGQSIGLFNFGDTQRARVSGIAYADYNNNGQRDAGETVLAGVLFQLENINSSTGIPSVQTDASGLFEFNNLAAGTYRLTVTIPTGYKQTTSNKGAQTYTLTLGSAKDGLRYGFKKL